MALSVYLCYDVRLYAHIADGGSKVKLITPFLLGVLFSVSAPPAHGQLLTTAFTYQGHLKDGGSPANGPHVMSFRLFDAATDGNTVGPAVNFDGIGGNPPPVQIANGLFTVSLNFGGAFSGKPRWLEITVNGMPLSPRQSVSPAPYALALPGLYTRENATSPNVIGGYSGNAVSTGVVGATIGGGGRAGLFQEENYITDNFGTIGGGQGNRIGDSQLTDDQAFATVGGGEKNTAFAAWSTVAGGNSNWAQGNWSAVGGGTYNIAYDYSCTIAGGNSNEAAGGESTIGGGSFNVAAGVGATIAGGSSNAANGIYPSVSGGAANWALADYSTVGGGANNIANGFSSTIPGGLLNASDGDFSFAAGRRAKANHPGAFVWADSTDADFASTADNQLIIRASGGVGIGTNEPKQTLSVNGSAGKPGGGSWATFSDARLKTHVVPLGCMLDRLLCLHGYQFEYTTDAVADGRGLPGPQIGLLAQEVATVFPDWVESDQDGYLFVTERATTALLVESLRELREEKDAQLARRDAEIDNLRESINLLRTRINADVESLRLENAQLRASNAQLENRLDRLEHTTRQLLDSTGEAR